MPIQIEIARRTHAAAQADQAKARDALKLTEDEVEKGIEQAQAGLEAAKADLVLAQQEYTRFTNLYKVEAVALRRSQEVTRSRDAAEAQQKLAAAKLAKAQADRTQIEVAKRTLEAAEKTTQKAVKGVDLAETGNAQIREVELLTAVKSEGVAEARRALDLGRGPAQVYADPRPFSRSHRQALPPPRRFRLARRRHPEHV